MAAKKSKRTSKKSTTTKKPKTTKGERKTLTVEDRLNKKDQRGETIFRVFACDENLRVALREKRGDEFTVAQTIRMALEEQLQFLVESLHQNGLAREGETRPVRWPLSENLLSALRLASAITAVSMQDLLLASLRLHCRKGGE